MMIKRIKTQIANLKISSKILLCMLVISLALVMFLGLFSSILFTRYFKEDSYTQTADAIQIGSQALEDSYQLLLNQVVNMASSSDFTRLVNDAHNNRLSSYGQNKSNLQDPWSALVLSNPLLDSVMAFGKNGEFYSLFTDTIKKDLSPSDYFGWDFSSVEGITWFPVCRNPHIRNNYVIPVVLPIGFIPKSNYLNVVKSPEEADVFLVLLLDNKRVNERLAIGQSSYADRTMYIASNDGMNLSLTADSPYCQTAWSQRVMDAVCTASASGIMQQLYDTSDYTIYSKSMDFSGLSLVCILPKDTLYRRLVHINALIALTVAVGLAMASVLAMKLSRFITRPLDRLITNVQNIENGTYAAPFQMKYQDEIGHLGQAINSMYGTIQQQFVRIKQSERAKFRSEIQLLSEQINPHFLYNTLECINMEVLGGHREEAASMITSLSDFLRIGLSYGNEVIPIEKEITHVKAYIDIMNHRFNWKIDFRCTIAPDLSQRFILKLILQPLAENSIRHGFGLTDNCSDQILQPSISVQLQKQGDAMILEVSDNGRGIDIEKATAALHPDTAETNRKQHVGLYNVYQRLHAYYGDVSISFESIPYFNNTVRIRFSSIAGRR